MHEPPPVVRIATVADAAAISRVQVETWRAAYACLMPDAMLAGLDVERNAARRIATWAERHRDPRTLDLVAERDGEVVGWASVGPTDQADLPGHGQLFALYALEAAWSTGVGHALMLAAEQRLRASGFDRACLLVLEGNARAAAFYERHGWRADGVTIVDEREAADGTDVPLVEHRRVRGLGVAP